MRAPARKPIPRTSSSSCPSDPAHRCNTAQPPLPPKEINMAETLIKVDLKQSPYENDMVHNRWHPDIPIVAWVKPGDDFKIETYDWTGGYIQNNDSADDVR